MKIRVTLVTLSPRDTGMRRYLGSVARAIGSGRHAPVSCPGAPSHAAPAVSTSPSDVDCGIASYVRVPAGVRGFATRLVPQIEGEESPEQIIKLMREQGHSRAMLRFNDLTSKVEASHKMFDSVRGPNGYRLEQFLQTRTGEELPSPPPCSSSPSPFFTPAARSPASCQC